MTGKTDRSIPGYRLTLGFSLVYLTLLVLVPLAGVLFKVASLTPSEFWQIVSAPRALASYGLSFGAALTAALINGVFGTIVAWVLIRYRFFGRRLVDAAVDLPLALPTAVAGIALTATWSKNGVLGGVASRLGVETAYSRVGVLIALVFVGLPFVVRSIQPVLESLDKSYEEAARTLGATPRQTFFRVVLPHLVPGIATGLALSFARGLGEYGSVVFISGNMPMRTEITPLLIMTKLEQYDERGATALAVVMLAASFLILLGVNGFAWRRSSKRREGRKIAAMSLATASRGN